jgi:prophage regulatory protein
MNVRHALNALSNCACPPLRYASHRYSESVSKDIPGNLRTSRNGMDALRKNRKAMPMRAQTNHESSAFVAADPTAQRAMQAARLLQEALTLLCSDSTMPLAQTIRRAPDRLLRLPEVERLTGLRRSAIYEQMRRGIFPRSVKAGQRTAAWPESAVQSWIAERMNGRIA